MQKTRLEFRPQLEGFFRRYKVIANGSTLFCFNPGVPDRDALDWNMKRPSIHPLYTPAGVPMTEQGAHNYPHHKACWIAHGRINGVNYYHDPQGGGRILARKLDWTERDGVGILDAEIEWVDAAFNVVIREQRRHWIRPGARAHRIDVRTQWQTPQETAEIAVEKHALFHIRVIEALSEAEGSTLRASNGKVGAAAIFDSEGNWIDCRGTVGGRKVGACIMGHPSECPQPLFARPYGTIALNPFFHQAMTLRRGETWNHTYSVTVYDEAEQFQAEAAYEEFAGTSFD
jgi:hypothetical protein